MSTHEMPLVAHSKPSSSRHTLCDPLSIENFFLFIQRIQQLFPSCLLHSNLISIIIKLSFKVLDEQQDRNSIRAVLVSIQGYFFPLTDVQKSQKLMFYHAINAFGFDIIIRVLNGIMGGRGDSKMLLTNFSETLYFIIRGCEENEVWKRECMSWIRKALYESYLSNVIQNIYMTEKYHEEIQYSLPDNLRNIDFREKIFEIFIKLSQNDQRRFRTFCQDLSKICNSEMTNDALFAYIGS